MVRASRRSATSWKSTFVKSRGFRPAYHTTMASRTFSLPFRAFAGTRPSIQAWRSTRSFATEVAPASTTVPVPSDFTTPITTPVVQDGQPQTLALKETDGSTSGKLRPVGVVVSAGKMERTVKVRLPSQKWNNYLRKVNTLLQMQCVHNVVLVPKNGCADFVSFLLVIAFQGSLGPFSPRPQLVAQHWRCCRSQTFPRRQTRPPRCFRDPRSFRHTHHRTTTRPQ